MHQSAPRRRSEGGRSRRRSGDLINWGNNNNHRDPRWHSPFSSPESEPTCGREDCCEQPRLMGNNNWPGDIPSQHCPPSIWLLTPLTATHKHGGRITLLHSIITNLDVFIFAESENTIVMGRILRIYVTALTSDKLWHLHIPRRVSLWRLPSLILACLRCLGKVNESNRICASRKLQFTADSCMSGWAWQLCVTTWQLRDGVVTMWWHSGGCDGHVTQRRRWPPTRACPPGGSWASSADTPSARRPTRPGPCVSS